MVHTTLRRSTFFKNKQAILLLVLAVTIVGSYLAVLSHAATPNVSVEAEAGSVISPALTITDPAASDGAALRFGPSYLRLVNVSTAAQLTAALTAAQPGDLIQLADGTYDGNFNSTRSGTTGAPIILNGSRKAVINGGNQSADYDLSLGSENTATTIGYWQFRGFSVTGGNKGIVWDNVSHSVIDSVSVHDIGEEGIHLRDDSADDTIENSIITKTGQIPADEGYGEGLYIGSAVSHWSDESRGSADHSNNAKILGNSISYTGAENIDVKEGTHGGLVQGNSFDGSGMCYDTGQPCNSADSFMDVKGQGWIITNNSGQHMHAVWGGGGATNDGFQVHVITGTGSEGSGTNDVFSANAVSDVGGYGFNIAGGASGSLVTCDNTVTKAGKGLSNSPCSGP